MRRLRGLPCPLRNKIPKRSDLCKDVAQKRLNRLFSPQDLRGAHERNPLIDRTQELIIPMSLRPIKEVCPLGRLVKPFRILALEPLEELTIPEFSSVICDEIIISHKFDRR